MFPASHLPDRMITLRMGVTALLLFSEIFLFSAYFDSFIFARALGLNAESASIIGATVQGSIAFFAALGLFLTSRHIVIASVLRKNVNVGFAVAHFFAAGMLAFSASGIASVAPPVNLTVLYTWITSVVLAHVSGDQLASLIRQLRKPILLAVIVGLSVTGVSIYNAVLWKYSASATLHGVAIILNALLPNVTFGPDAQEIGTPEFRVVVSHYCSGMEGVYLSLVFGTVWLFYARRSLRFPQALLLLPLAVVGTWLVNCIRIAALVLIGNSGRPDIAAGGFHSQAGWIGFNLVAATLLACGRSIPSLRADPRNVSAEERTDATTAYLLPFAGILAASLITHAASNGHFEPLYPLRFLVAGGLLVWLAGQYRELDWRFGWTAVLAGAAVAALWIPFVLWQSGQGISASFEAEIMRLTPIERLIWLSVRCLSAIVTVPIAEELAFRGFLLRRLQISDFESLSFRQATWVPMALSSLAFGVMHGRHWLAGTIAGVVYAWVARRHGRIGDAVVAHATSNALIVAWVLVFRDWALW